MLFLSMSKGVLFLLLFFISFALKADDKFGAIGRYSIEANYQFGRIIPHNNKFKAPVTGFTNSGELSFYKQTLGEKAWQRKLHYPELGGAFVFVYNADQKIFGNVYIALAVAKFWIVRSRYVDFYIRVGTGLAFVPTHFNLISNPENNVIGSTINSADQIRLGLDFKPSPEIHLTLGINLTHYSNASAQRPNLGVNVPAVSIGVRYFPKVSKDLKYNRSPIPKPWKRNEVMVKFGIAYSEMFASGGPKYFHYIGTVNYARYTSIANKVLAGACGEFSQGDHDFALLQDKDPKYSPTVKGLKFSLFAGDEILMGRTGIFFMAGAYVFNPTKVTPVFAKLGLNYYFPDFGKNNSSRFFIGINLKTHFLIAQYYEVNTGIAF
jgi:hypothetical protein